MATAEAMRRAAKISGADESAKVIAVSAGGRSANEKKITDELISAYSLLNSGEGERKVFSDLSRRISKLVGELKIQFDIAEELMKIGDEESKTSSPDFLISRGEYLYARIFARASARKFVDSAEIVKFFGSGELNVDFSRFLIAEKFRETGGFITGGFYGGDESGNVRLFPRGGGDITGALLALAVDADVYENYTDVDGILPVPPRLTAFIGGAANLPPLKEISFSQTEILCDFSVNVLHRGVLKLLKGSGIPVRVKNTFNEFSGGTLVSENAVSSEFFFAAEKFGTVKSALEKRKTEVSLYDKFLSDSARIENDDYVCFFSASERSERLIDGLKNYADFVVRADENGSLISLPENDFNRLSRSFCALFSECGKR